MSAHALLFTDVVDSTVLAERLGDERAAKLWAAHDRCARELLAKHEGREIDRTDGFFALFDSVFAAACFALRYHEALRELDIKARVGLHFGKVTLRENTASDINRGAKAVEVEGLAKPFAARVMALAQGGQTLLSADARVALDSAGIEGAAIDSHGYYRLKGIDAPVELFELGVDGLSAFAPPPDTDKAYRVVRAGDLWTPLREVRHNLPAERDAFIGRSAELRLLAQRLDAGTRLVTLLGPGGAGKTRLAARYGRTWLGDWPGGVYLCDLSEARSLDGIFAATAVALGVPLGRAEPAVQLGHVISARGRCLVILDNFEQVAQHAPASLGRWLERAEAASFVVTSRERLHVTGEEILAVDPLLLATEAIELFATRARAQVPAFLVEASNRVPVTEIVRLLDGLPLAIELAAARIGVLSVTQIVDRLRHRFQLLVGARGPSARQATLRAAIDWSWELLPAWEQAALAQCAVFEGGFTLDAAEAVLDLSAWSAAPATLDTVQALVDKSLLRRWRPAGSARYDIDEPYFGMYLSIHEYAAAKLETQSAASGLAGAQMRHGAYFARFGTRAAIDALFGHGGVARRAALALERNNLVVACRRAIARHDGEVAVNSLRATWEVLDLQGPLALGIDLGAQVLAIEGLSAAMRGSALLAHALAAWRSGWLAEAQASYDEALSLDDGDPLIWGNLALVHHQQGRAVEAQNAYERALALAQARNDRRFEGIVRGNLGALALEQGRVDDALRQYELALAIHRESGNRRNEGISLGNLGNLHLEQGRVDAAKDCYERALPIHREVGNRADEGTTLINIGEMHADRGEHALARASYDQALALVRDVGSRRLEGAVLGNLGALLAEQGDQGAALEALRVGEALLREVDDRWLVALALCSRVAVHLARGEAAAAHGALGEAEAIAAMLGAGSESRLAKQIVQLRARIEA